MPSKKISRTWTVSSQNESSGCYGDRYEQVELGETYELTDGRRGVVKFIGQTAFRPGPEWIGLELTSGKGKNNGVKMNVRYFKCEKANRGLFVPLTKIKRKVPKIPEKPVVSPQKRTTAEMIRYISYKYRSVKSSFGSPSGKTESSTPKSPKKSASYQLPVYSWQDPTPKPKTPPAEFVPTPLNTRDASRNILELENGPSVVKVGKRYMLEDGRVGKVAWIGAGWQALKDRFEKPKYYWKSVKMPEPKIENLPSHSESWGYVYDSKDVPTKCKRVLIEGGELFGLVVKQAGSGNVSWPEPKESSLSSPAPIESRANPFALEGLEKAQFRTDGTVMKDNRLRWVFGCEAWEECVFVQPWHLVEEFVTKDDISLAGEWFEAKIVLRAAALKAGLEAAFGQFPDVGIANLISCFEGQERIYVARGMKSYNGDCLIEKADEALVLQPNGRAMRSFKIQYKRVSGSWGDNGCCGGVSHPARTLYGAQDGTWSKEGRHIIFEWIDSSDVKHKFAPQTRYLITEGGLQQDFSRIIDWRTTDRDHRITDEYYSYNMDDMPCGFSEGDWSLQPHEGPHVSELYEPVDSFPEGLTVLEYRGEGKNGDTIRLKDMVTYIEDGLEIHGDVDFLGFVDKDLLPEGFPEGPVAGVSNLNPNKHEVGQPKYGWSYTPRMEVKPGDFIWFNQEDHFVSKKKKGRFVAVKDLQYVRFKN